MSDTGLKLSNSELVIGLKGGTEKEHSESVSDKFSSEELADMCRKEQYHLINSHFLHCHHQYLLLSNPTDILELNLMLDQIHQCHHVEFPIHNKA